MISSAPRRDISRLLYAFAERAFRRPVEQSEVDSFVQIAVTAFDQGVPLQEALRTGYRSILCSPRFLYFHETPGVLDQFALASRLSYFLQNSMPDDELMQQAKAGQLQDRKVLTAQVDRLLDGKNGRQFVSDLAGEWLDLRLIDFTEPDPRLYPAFDVIVQQSMLDETITYLHEMLHTDASVLKLIDSDHTYLNSRLARFYDIPGVHGDQISKVSLMPSYHRGGVLTQGSILKVTANGTTTSPVIRGVWIGERLLGEHIPPPPQGVPAIEPDIRGATSIRDLLARHRSNDSCASCHVKIDPPGFALENYDPSGRYRTHYGSADRGRKARGVEIDASYELSDGRRFENVEQFRSLIMADPESLARNLASKLITVGTGASPQFADRAGIEQIVEAAEAENYGFESIIQSVVASSIFQTK